MSRIPLIKEHKHSEVSGDSVYFKPKEDSPGMWLHKNVFIEVCNRRGKSILPELMAKLLEKRQELKK